MAEHSKKIVEGLNNSGLLPYEVVWKPTLITNAVIRKTLTKRMQTRVCRRHHMDAYVLAGKVMDSGLAGVQKAADAFPYAV